MIKLSIIILSFNTSDLLQKCLKSITKNCFYPFEIIVVDNNSSDSSVKMVKLNFPEVRVICNKSNEGYSRGNNIGAKYAQGKYLLFLNSDTEIVGESLNTMIEFLDNNKEYGILGPKLLNCDKTTQKSVGNFYNLRNTISLLFGLEKIFGLGRRSPEKMEKVDWVSGACFVIRKNDFDQIGGFCEELFMYMEEVELCYRAKRQGIDAVFLPNAQVIHSELGSSQGIKTNAILGIYSGLIYFYKKYCNKFDIAVLIFLLKVKASLMIIFGRMFGKVKLYETYEQAYRLVK